jgi:hypothetical protein
MAQFTKIPQERITVIYNPSVVGAEVWEKAHAPLDHPWFKPDQPPVLVAVGRLQMQKIIRPCSMHSPGYAESIVRLLILGEGRNEHCSRAYYELGLEQI